jgi:ubiquinone/menaquinone biosynthesis C-methylase UbiE
MSGKKISEKLEETLWAFYAGAYDDLARYYRPYRDVLDESAKQILAGRPGKRVLDAGCGTGELSMRLLEKGNELRCLDISGAMLELFRAKLAAKPDLSKRAEVVRGDLNLKLPYTSRSFDAVASVHALFMLDDKKKAVLEFDRVLKPGGLMVISHNRPVLVGSLFAVELRENGFLGLAINFIRLFRVGMINLLLSRIHRKLYGITPVSDIIDLLKKKGYRLLEKKIMYRGFDDFIVLRKRKV